MDGPHDIIVGINLFSDVKGKRSSTLSPTVGLRTVFKKPNYKRNKITNPSDYSTPLKKASILHNNIGPTTTCFKSIVNDKCVQAVIGTIDIKTFSQILLSDYNPQLNKIGNVKLNINVQHWRSDTSDNYSRHFTNFPRNIS